MSQEVADLYIAIRTNAAHVIPDFLQAGASGERMALQITAGAQAILRDTAAIVRDARTVGDAWGTAASETALAMREMQAQTTLLATEMEMATAKAARSTEVMAAKIDAAAASTTATMEGKVAALQKIGVGVGVVAIAVAAVTTKMAGDFQQDTTKLVTSAGETQQGLDDVRQGMLALAGDVGVGAEHLSEAIYKIESAGYHGAAGLGVLRSAEQGAKAEGADGVLVADALSSALRDYYPHAQSAAEVTAASADTMSKFIGATSAGKMTFADLAGSLNSILPVSSAANISLSDTLGVLASMTVHGISASQATQNMADAVRHLQAPTQTMSKAMATLGIDSTDVAAKLGERGLAGTMQMLAERVRNAMPPGSDRVILQLGNALSLSTPKVQELGQKVLDGSISMGEFTRAAKDLDPISARQAMSFATLAGSMHQLGNQQISGAEVMQTYGGMMQRVMGDATGLKVALMTTGENAGYTNDAIKTISGSTADAEGNVKGWTEIQGSFNQRLSEAKAGLGAFGIEIGTVFLPAATKIAGVIGDVTSWLAKHKDAAVAVAIVVGGVLTVALFAAAAAAWAFITPLLPVIGIAALVVAAIAGVAFAAYMLITHWSDVTAFFGRLWEGIESAFSTAIDWIVGIFRDWYPLILGILSGGILLLPLLFIKYWDQIKAAFAAATAWVVDLLSGWASWLTGLPGRALSALAALGSMLLDLARDAWSGFLHTTGTAIDDVLAFLGSLPGKAGLALGRLVGTIARIGVDAWDGFTASLKRRWDATVAWFHDLPDNVAKLMIDAYLWLQGPGRDLISGALAGINAKWVDFQAWFNSIPDRIKAWWADSDQWLSNEAQRLITGALVAVGTKWLDFQAWFNSIPDRIKAWWADSGQWLSNEAHELVAGVERGASDEWHSFTAWLSSLGPNIQAFFTDAGSWLVNSGWNLLVGLWNGISSAGSWLWNKITDFCSGIIKGFNDAFGVKSPSTVMATVGRFLSEGLAVGITDHAHKAVAAATDMAGRVIGAMSGMQATATLAVQGGTGLSGGVGVDGAVAASSIAGAGGLAPVAASGGGVQVINVTVPVAGSVVAERDLQQRLQTAVARYAGRNSSAGWTPAFS